MNYVNDVSDLYKLIKSNFSKFEGNNIVIYVFIFLIAIFLNSNLYLDKINIIEYFKTLTVIYFTIIVLYLFLSFLIHRIRISTYRGKGVIYIDSKNFSIENNIKTFLVKDFKNLKINFINYGKLFYISNIEDMKYYYSKYDLEFIIYVDGDKNIFYSYKGDGFYFKILLEGDNSEIVNKILIVVLLKIIENNSENNEKIDLNNIYNIFNEIIKSDTNNSFNYLMLRNYCISKLSENKISLRTIEEGNTFGNDNLLFPEYNSIIDKILEIINENNFNFLSIENYFLLIYRGYLYNLLFISNTNNVKIESIYENLFKIFDTLFKINSISDEKRLYVIFHYYLYGIFRKYKLDKSTLKTFLINKGLSEKNIEKYFTQRVSLHKHTIERAYIYAYIFDKSEFLENIKTITKEIYSDKLDKRFQFYLDLKITK